MDSFHLSKTIQQRMSDDRPKTTWYQSNATVLEDNVIAPDNSFASLIYENTANSEHFSYGTPGSIRSYSQSTLVAYVKYAGRSLQLTHKSKDNDHVYTRFNLLTGKIESENLQNDSQYLGSSIRHIDNGWYRCSMTLNMLSGSFNGICFYYLYDEENNLTTYTGDGNSGIYVWKNFINEGDDNECVPDFISANSDIQESVNLPVDYKFIRNDRDYNFRSISTTGLRFEYQNGIKKGFRVPIKNLVSPDAKLINTWWKNRELLKFYNGADYQSYNVMIINNKPPFNEFALPYTTQLNGIIELAEI